MDLSIQQIQSDAKLILKSRIWELSHWETCTSPSTSTRARPECRVKVVCPTVLSISCDLAQTIRHNTHNIINVIYRSAPVCPRKPTCYKVENVSQNINVKCYSPLAKSHQYQDIYQSFCGKLAIKLSQVPRKQDTNNPFCCTIKYKYTCFICFNTTTQCKPVIYFKNKIHLNKREVNVSK